MSEYKKFDLEAALRGEPVWLVDQRDNHIVSWDGSEVVLSKRMNRLVLVGNKSMVCTFNVDGSTGTFYRLVMAPKPKRKVKRWVNVYARHGGFFECGGFVFDTEDSAADGAHPANQYVATVPIEFEVEDRG